MERECCFYIYIYIYLTAYNKNNCYFLFAGQSSQDSVEKKKKRKVLTELDVIISILDETEMQIV